jgi:hypothetical protein
MRSLILAAVVLCGAGCRSLDQQFVEAIAKGDALILKDFEAYVRADSTLSDEEKGIRLLLVKERRKLLEEALRDE